MLSKGIADCDRFQIAHATVFFLGMAGSVVIRVF
jgi:hypothetical protein